MLTYGSCGAHIFDYMGTVSTFCFVVFPPFNVSLLFNCLVVGDLIIIITTLVILGRTHWDQVLGLDYP